MIDDRFLPRVWTNEGYYYQIFSELGITYENKNLPFTKENIKDINWTFRWRFNHSNGNVDIEYINTLEQCTGLKDKNGKLIYEGDIVRVIEQCMTNTLDRNYPMLFNEKTAKFGFKHPDGHFFYFTNNEDFSYEIIGNIHENADLLENKK